MDSQWSQESFFCHMKCQNSFVTVDRMGFINELSSLQDKIHNLSNYICLDNTEIRLILDYCYITVTFIYGEEIIIIIIIEM